MTTNYEVARAYWDTEIKRDLDAIMAFYHEDVTFAAPGWSLQGRDAIRGFFADASGLCPSGARGGHCSRDDVGNRVCL
jgi:ketosteroid isomerase-like protein